MAGYRPEGLVTGTDATDFPADDPADLTADGEASSDAPASGPGSGVPARFGTIAWLRWTWRQLTSMRVALLLLMLLAVAALPGAFFPQRPQDPARVAEYYVEHPDLAPVLDRWGFFDVYASPWFAAVYLLLFVSLVGCIVPRAIEHARALRRQPPKAPRRFTRFPVRDAFVASGTPQEVLERAAGSLKGYRVRREEGAAVSLSAERGYARETGNIVFHLALVGLLLSVGYGSLVHYRGQVLVVEGDTFANSRLAYDSFDAGPWFAADSLEPFRLRLDTFDAEFDDFGLAKEFQANMTLTSTDGEESARAIRVNDPLRAGGASVYLMGNGFAPLVQVHDGVGELAFSGAVPFIPADQTTYASRGVIKVPDTTTDHQIGLNGWFLPTGVVDEGGNAFSLSPDPDSPVLVLDVWYGDLGLDDGVPQNVYQLDTTAMTQVMTEVDGVDEPYRVVVRPGETVELPEGLGTITFEALPRFAGFDLRYDPTLPWVLTFALLALAGLSASLFLPRRRVFVRVGTDGTGRTVVTAAALARGDDPGLTRELARVLAPLRSTTPRPEESSAQGTTDTHEPTKTHEGEPND